MKCLDAECPMRSDCSRYEQKKRRGEKYFQKTPRWNNECNFFLKSRQTPEEIREEMRDFRQETERDMKS